MEFFFFFCLFQAEPLQLSFSVAALLGDRQQYRKDASTIELKKFDGTRPNLPPTPQPSDTEEEEQPARKRRCIETNNNYELTKVNNNISDFFFFLLSMIKKL